MAGVFDRTYQYFVVAFLDLMGQQDLLRQLDLPPKTVVDFETAAKELDGIVHVVLDIRRKFEEFVTNYRTVSLDEPSRFAQEPRFPTKFELRTFVRGFSDSFMLAVPLSRPAATPETLMALRMVLSASGVMMMDCLERGHVLRGGIDIGLGTQLSDNEVYGPALARPYALESRVADFPRIVIGPALTSFLAEYANARGVDPIESVAKIMAFRCCQMLGQDLDGKDILDYAGSHFAQMLGREESYARFTRATHFLRKARDRFASESNEKLRRRYDCILKYLESRAALWGVTPRERAD